MIGPDNGLSTFRRQAIISTDGDILLTGPLGEESQMKIQNISCKKLIFESRMRNGSLDVLKTSVDL